jgi:cytochrome c-type biogenesis protein
MLESLAAQLGAEAGSLTLASFGLALLGGLIAGFGPCVLPMIPAIFGYITGQIPEADRGNPRSATTRSVTLTLTFILGLAATSAAIGGVAAAVGHAILIGRWAYWIVAAISLVMGLQLLGVIELRFAGLNRFVSRRPETKGYPGALLFGALFGLIITPCATPVLAVIATLAAASGDIPTGTALLFVYGLGRGFPLLLVALFSGAISGMRVFSDATVWLSRAGGAALIGVAIYLVWIA